MNIIDLAQGVQNILPGAPFESVQPLALAAVREFCNRSLWYQVDITPTLVVDEAEYDLSVPSGTEMVQVIAVAQDERFLEVNRTPLYDESGSTQMVYYSTPTVNLGLVPAPDADSDAVTVTVALRPTLLSITVDDRLSRWGETISAGALSRLFANPVSGWYSAQQSDYYRVLFRDGCRKAGNEAAAQFIKTLPNVTMGTLV